MKQIDLHVHSNKSDGTYTPAKLVDYAIEKGLAAFALTDHDTTAGLAEAISYAADKPVEVVPGIEFSSEYEGKDVHVVGLYIRFDTPAFQSKLKDFVDSRINRNIKMCRNLQEAGIDISYEKLSAENPGAVITRAHYAAYLTEHGYVSNRAEAFARYVGDNCKYYVPREKITPAQAVEMILHAKGVPILAHPPLYHMGNERLNKLVGILKQAGLMGIEAIYSSYNSQEERDMRRLADKYELLISGGSDFHGDNKPGLDLGSGYGKMYVPYEILENIKKAANAACNDFS